MIRSDGWRSRGVRVRGPRDPTEAEKGSLGQGGLAAPWQLQTRLLLAEMAPGPSGRPRALRGALLWRAGHAARARFSHSLPGAGWPP